MEEGKPDINSDAHGRSKGISARWNQRKREREQRLIQRYKTVLQSSVQGVVPLREFDPLQREQKLSRWFLVAGTCFMLSVAVHLLTVGGSIFFGQWTLSPEKSAVDDTPASITVVEVESDDEAMSSDAETVELVEPEQPETDIETIAEKNEEAETIEPPALDPIDVPEEVVEPAKQEPVRRVIGLEQQSVIEGGSGPRFQVGNTRMGRTARVASDPTQVEEIDRSARSNQVSSRIPTGAIKRTRPKRLYEPECLYPPLLASQGLEADIVLQVLVDEQGAVRSAKVIKGAEQAVFNEEAQKCALQHRYQPATKNGEPVSYTLRFTHRWRSPN